MQVGSDVRLVSISISLGSAKNVSELIDYEMFTNARGGIE